MDGVGLLPDIYDQRFAFTASAADKTYHRVVFKSVQVCNCIHVYIDLIAMRASQAFPMCHLALQIVGDLPE
jgi:hypothetical protein